MDVDFRRSIASVFLVDWTILCMSSSGEDKGKSEEEGEDDDDELEKGTEQELSQNHNQNGTSTVRFDHSEYLLTLLLFRISCLQVL